jgi:hypothetical protein
MACICGSYAKPVDGPDGPECPDCGATQSKKLRPKKRNGNRPTRAPRTEPKT